MDTPVWGNDYPINPSVKLLSNYQINFGMCDHVTHGTEGQTDGQTTYDKAKYKPPTPTQLNSTVELRRRCVLNSQLVDDSLDESEQFADNEVELRASCRRCERTSRQS